MCDRHHYDELEDRVDELENRLTAVETSIADMRNECKEGFAKLGDELGRIYSERAKWGAWARENLGHALRWLGYIVLAACGINQAGNIIHSVSAAWAK